MRVTNDYIQWAGDAILKDAYELGKGATKRYDIPTLFINHLKKRAKDGDETDALTLLRNCLAHPDYPSWYELDFKITKPKRLKQFTIYRRKDTLYERHHPHVKYSARPKALALFSIECRGLAVGDDKRFGPGWLAALSPLAPFTLEMIDKAHFEALWLFRRFDMKMLPNGVLKVTRLP